MTGVTRGDGTEGGEEGKGEGGKRRRNSCTRTDGRAGQSKEVQEVLADLKTKFNLNSVHYVRLPPTFAFSEIG